jgi:TolA-binding protein
VVKYISDNFIPVKIHIKERPKDFERFGAEWTPTMIVAESDGTERYRFEGYMPAEDYLAHLQLGLAKAAFSRGQFGDAARAFRAVVDRYPKSEVAPEAVYWAAASAYKSSGKPEALAQGGTELREKYPQSLWAKRGSVWVA